MIDPLTTAIVALGMSSETAFGAFLIGNAGTIAAVTAVTGTLAISSSLQQRARAKARAAYNASLKDREVTIRSAIAPRRVIYGRDKVSGPLVYAQSTGDKGQFLHLVIALAAHECDAIEEVWFNDTLLPEPDASGWITSGPFGEAVTLRGQHTATVDGSGTITLPRTATRVTDATLAASEGGSGDIYTPTHTSGSATVSGLPVGASITVGYEYSVAANKVRIRKHLGGPGQVADADLVAESGGKWTSAHKGVGICYLYARLEYDPDMFGQVGVPNISCVVRGKKLLDPRTGTTAWTQNNQLIVADWLQDQTFGLRATSAQVPSSEINAGANICDEAVAIDGGGTTQARYTFNGSFTTDQAPLDVLEDLLSGMAGTCVWTQGRWLVRPGAYRTPAAGAEITDDDLAGPVTIQPRASRSALFNAVRATYRDPAQKWAEVQAPLVTNSTYEAQDGGVRVVRNIQLPGAMDPIRAQRLAKIELERARQAVAVQLATNLRPYDLAPTDTALVLLARYGWGAGKVFEVSSRTWSAEGALQYSLRETAASVYAWAYGEATTIDDAPDTALPSPYTRPAAPASLAAASGTSHLVRQGDGTIISRVSLTWAASTDPFVQQGGAVQVEWQASGASSWQALPPLQGDATQAYISPAPDGQAIVARVRFANGVGTRGAWAYTSHVVEGKSAAPTTASGFAGAVQKARVRWAWARNADVDFAATEVRSADSNWGSSAVPPLWRGATTDWTEAVASAGSITRYVRHVDSSGNVSASSATSTVTVTSADLLIGTADIAAGAATTVLDFTVTAGPITRTNIS